MVFKRISLSGLEGKEKNVVIMILLYYYMYLVVSACENAFSGRLLSVQRDEVQTGIGFRARTREVVHGATITILPNT